PGLKRSRCLLVSCSRSNRTCAICPSAAGKARQAPGIAAKPLAFANRRASPGRSAHIASHDAPVANVMGMADGAGAISNTECMRLSVVDDGAEGGRRGVSSYQRLGLTVYCSRVQIDQFA